MSAMNYENAVAKFWGHPNLAIYYANDWGDLRIVNRVLFGICYKELYCSEEGTYNAEVIAQFKNFLDQLLERTESNPLEGMPEEGVSLDLYVNVTQFLNDL